MNGAAVTTSCQVAGKSEVVLVTDRPWEGPNSAYFTAFQDGPLVRLYYRGIVCGNDLSENRVTCYAESPDGIHFSRPNLGLVAFQGSKENNIIDRGIKAHNFAPFRDDNPAAKPDDRYKALAGISGKLYAFVAADGIHWHKRQAEPVMTKGAFDSLNLAFWDHRTQNYRSFSRYADEGVRAIQSCTSTGFVQWTDPVRNRYGPTSPKEHFYTNGTRPCPGAPHLYLSFPKRFVRERKKFADYPEPGVSDAAFMTSRDGVNWDRTFLEAWVRPGLDRRNWTQRSNMPAWGIVQFKPGEFSMYLTEHYAPSPGQADWRRAFTGCRCGRTAGPRPAADRKRAARGNLAKARRRRHGRRLPESRSVADNLRMHRDWHAEREIS